MATSILEPDDGQWQHLADPGCGRFKIDGTGPNAVLVWTGPEDDLRPVWQSLKSFSQSMRDLVELLGAKPFPREPLLMGYCRNGDCVVVVATMAGGVYRITRAGMLEWLDRAETVSLPPEVQHAIMERAAGHQPARRKLGPRRRIQS